MSQNQNDLVLLDAAIEQEKKENYPDEESGDFFERFVAKEILKNEDLSFEEIETSLTGGSRDGGIDGIFLFINDQLVLGEEEVNLPKKSSPIFKLHIIQASQTQGFKEDAVTKLESSLSDLLDFTKKLNTFEKIYNEDILDKFIIFQTLYKGHASKFPKLEIKFYYATRSTDAPHPSVLTRVDKLKKNILDKFNENCEVSFDFCGAKELWKLYNKRATQGFKLNIYGGSSISTTKKDTVCFVELAEYNKFITDEKGLRKNIFDSNVRDYQGDVEVNKNIESTLKDYNSEGDFWWLNNGITIICTNFQLTGNELTIEDPQIVNGLQTSNQIFNYFKDNNLQSGLQRHVLIRVIKPDNEKSRDKIIRATNSQTNIPPDQLRGTDKIHRDIESFFKTNGIYYDRRKNYYINAGKQRNLIISISGLSQAVNAIFLQRPHSSRAKPSTLTKDPERYREIFNEKYDLLLYLNVAKVMMKIEKFMKSDLAKSYSKDLKYHLAMFAVAKGIGKLKPNAQDLISDNYLSLEDSFLLECLELINEAIVTLKTNDVTSINKIVKNSESVAVVLKLLEGNISTN
jgi:hypothetical protein